MSTFLLDIAPEPPIFRFGSDYSAIILLAVSVVVLAACGFFIYKYRKKQ
ncbi:MAG: hypothetical protein IIT37_11695 [Bacteroidales bacterium]|nr:hypothetical protein [Bacteroidales bacterium]